MTPKPGSHLQSTGYTLKVGNHQTVKPHLCRPASQHQCRNTWCPRHPEGTAVFRNLTGNDPDVAALTFYPNPASGMITITDGNYTNGRSYKIINADGKLVASGLLSIITRLIWRGLIRGVWNLFFVMDRKLLWVR